MQIFIPSCEVFFPVKENELLLSLKFLTVYHAYAKPACIYVTERAFSVVSWYVYLKRVVSKAGFAFFGGAGMGVFSKLCYSSPLSAAFSLFTVSVTWAKPWLENVK